MHEVKDGYVIESVETGEVHRVDLHPDHQLPVCEICRLAIEQKKVEIESEAKLH